VFFAPIPEKGISDFIAHGSIIQVFTVLERKYSILGTSQARCMGPSVLSSFHEGGSAYLPSSIRTALRSVSEIRLPSYSYPQALILAQPPMAPRTYLYCTPLGSFTSPPSSYRIRLPDIEHHFFLRLPPFPLLLSWRSCN